MCSGDEEAAPDVETEDVVPPMSAEREKDKPIRTPVDGELSVDNTPLLHTLDTPDSIDAEPVRSVEEKPTPRDDALTHQSSSSANPTFEGVQQQTSQEKGESTPPKKDAVEPREDIGISLGLCTPKIGKKTTLEESVNTPRPVLEVTTPVSMPCELTTPAPIRKITSPSSMEFPTPAPIMRGDVMKVERKRVVGAALSCGKGDTTPRTSSSSHTREESQPHEAKRIKPNTDEEETEKKPMDFKQETDKEVCEDEQGTRGPNPLTSDQCKEEEKNATNIRKKRSLSADNRGASSVDDAGCEEAVEGQKSRESAEEDSRDKNFRCKKNTPITGIPLVGVSMEARKEEYDKKPCHQGAQEKGLSSGHGESSSAAPKKSSPLLLAHSGAEERGTTEESEETKTGEPKPKPKETSTEEGQKKCAEDAEKAAGDREPNKKCIPSTPISMNESGVEEEKQLKNKEGEKGVIREEKTDGEATGSNVEEPPTNEEAKNEPRAMSSTATPSPKNTTYDEEKSPSKGEETDNKASMKEGCASEAPPFTSVRCCEGEKKQGSLPGGKDPEEASMKEEKTEGGATISNTPVIIPCPPHDGVADKETPDEKEEATTKVPDETRCGPGAPTFPGAHTTRDEGERRAKNEEESNTTSTPEDGLISSTPDIPLCVMESIEKSSNEKVENRGSSGNIPEAEAMYPSKSVDNSVPMEGEKTQDKRNEACESTTPEARSINHSGGASEPVKLAVTPPASSMMVVDHEQATSAPQEDKPQDDHEASLKALKTTIEELKHENHELKDAKRGLESSLHVVGRQCDDHQAQATADATAIKECKTAIRALKESNCKLQSELHLAGNQLAPLEAELECHKRYLNVMNSEAQDYKMRYMEERSRYEALEKEVDKKRLAHGSEVEKIMVEMMHTKRVVEDETRAREAAEKACVEARALIKSERDRVAELEKDLRTFTRKALMREEELASDINVWRKYGEQKQSEASFNQDQAVGIQNANDHLQQRITELEQECEEYRVLVQKWVPNNAFVDVKQAKEQEKERLEALQAECDELKAKQKDALCRAHMDLDQAHQEQERALENLKQEHEKKDEEYEYLMHDLRKAERRIKILESTVEDLSNDSAAYLLAQCKLRSKYCIGADHYKTYDGMGKWIEDLVKEHARTSSECHRLRGEVKEVLTSERAKLAKEWKAEMDKKNMAIDKHKRECQIAIRKVELVEQSKLAHKEEMIRKLSDEMEKQNREIAGLKEGEIVVNRQKEVEMDYHRVIGELRGEFARASDAEMAARTKSVRLQNQLEDTQNEMQLLRANEKYMEEKYEALGRLQNEMKIKLMQTEQSLSEAENNAWERKINMGKLDGQIQILQNSQADSLATVRVQKREIEKMKVEKETMQHKITQLNNQIESILETSADKDQRLYGPRAEEMRNLKNDYDRTVEQRNEVFEKLLASQEREDELTQKLTELELQFMMVNDERKLTEDQLKTRIKANNPKKILELGNELKETYVQNNKLKEEITHLKELGDQMKQRNRESSQRTQELLLQQEATKERIDQLQNLVNVANKGKEEIMGENEKIKTVAEERIAKLEKEAKVTLKEKMDVEEQIANKDAMVKKLESAIASHLSEGKMHAMEREQLSVSVSALEKQIETLQQQCAQFKSMRDETALELARLKQRTPDQVDPLADLTTISVEQRVRAQSQQILELETENSKLLSDLNDNEKERSALRKRIEEDQKTIIQLEETKVSKEAQDDNRTNFTSIKDLLTNIRHNQDGVVDEYKEKLKSMQECLDHVEDEKREDLKIRQNEQEEEQHKLRMLGETEESNQIRGTRTLCVMKKMTEELSRIRQELMEKNKKMKEDEKALKEYQEYLQEEKVKHQQRDKEYEELLNRVTRGHKVVQTVNKAIAENNLVLRDRKRSRDTEEASFASDPSPKRPGGTIVGDVKPHKKTIGDDKTSSSREECEKEVKKSVSCVPSPSEEAMTQIKVESQQSHKETACIQAGTQSQSQQPTSPAPDPTSQQSQQSEGSRKRTSMSPERRSDGAREKETLGDGESEERRSKSARKDDPTSVDRADEIRDKPESGSIPKSEKSDDEEGDDESQAEEKEKVSNNEVQGNENKKEDGNIMMGSDEEERLEEKTPKDGEEEEEEEEGELQDTQEGKTGSEDDIVERAGEGEQEEEGDAARSKDEMDARSKETACSVGEREAGKEEGLDAQSRDEEEKVGSEEEKVEGRRTGEVHDGGKLMGDHEDEETHNRGEAHQIEADAHDVGRMLDDESGEAEKEDEGDTCGGPGGGKEAEDEGREVGSQERHEKEDEGCEEKAENQQQQEGDDGAMVEEEDKKDEEEEEEKGKREEEEEEECEDGTHRRVSDMETAGEKNDTAENGEEGGRKAKEGLGDEEDAKEAAQDGEEKEKEKKMDTNGGDEGKLMEAREEGGNPPLEKNSHGKEADEGMEGGSMLEEDKKEGMEEDVDRKSSRSVETEKQGTREGTREEELEVDAKSEGIGALNEKEMNENEPKEDGGALNEDGA